MVSIIPEKLYVLATTGSWWLNKACMGTMFECDSLAKIETSFRNVSNICSDRPSQERRQGHVSYSHVAVHGCTAIFSYRLPQSSLIMSEPTFHVSMPWSWWLDDMWGFCANSSHLGTSCVSCDSFVIRWVGCVLRLFNKTDWSRSAVFVNVLVFLCPCTAHLTQYIRSHCILVISAVLQKSHACLQALAVRESKKYVWNSPAITMKKWIGYN